MGLHMMEQTKNKCLETFILRLFLFKLLNPLGHLVHDLLCLLSCSRKQILGILILRGQCKLLKAGLSAF